MAFTQLAQRLKRPLSLGAAGPDVKLLQEALNGWSDVQKPLKVDGRFGKATHHAVLFVQFWEHLKEDGVVGPKTAEKLGLEMGPDSGGSPVVIRFEEPPRPPMTPPLENLVDVIIDGMKPLHGALDDSILLTRTADEDVKHKWERHKWSNEIWGDFEDDLKKWSAELPQGNLAAAKLRTAFETYIKWMHGELNAISFYSKGGYFWRFHPVLDKVPVDSIVGIADRVLRGEQATAVAIAQLRMTFDQFNRVVSQVPHTDANGVHYG